MDRQGGGCDVEMWVSGVFVVREEYGAVWKVDEVKRRNVEWISGGVSVVVWSRKSE